LFTLKKAVVPEDNAVNNLRIAVMPFIPNRGTGPELLDLSPEFYTLEEHHGGLAELRLVNRYLGDVRVILKHLSTMAAGKVRNKWTVLDVATGSADIPVAIAGWARKRGIKVCITGVDVNSQAIRSARKVTGEDPLINFAVADGLDLPFRENSFDFVLCSKTLHHFTAEEAVRFIQGISRIARQGYIIMDLRRSWVAYVLIFLLTRLFSRNRITRFDGPLSVLRSFTPRELESLASCAGALKYRISKEPFWRMVLCCMRQPYPGTSHENQAAT